MRTFVSFMALAILSILAFPLILGWMVIESGNPSH